MRWISITAFMVLVSTAAFSQVVYDEAVNGDLSDDNRFPTMLFVSEGSNIVMGSTIPDPIDRDFFWIDVPNGLQLSAITLLTYDTFEDQSFMAIEAGSVISSIENLDNALGSALVGADPGAQEGDDVLDDLGLAVLGGAGFTPPLSAGSYAFWFQETAEPVDYALDIVLTPIPGLGLGLEVGGSCPGEVTLSVSGATPSTAATILFAAATGEVVIPPAFPCAGTTIGLGQTALQSVGAVPIDGKGSGILDVNTPAAACGGFLQILDTAACTISNVETLD